MGFTRINVAIKQGNIYGIEGVSPNRLGLRSFTFDPDDVTPITNVIEEWYDSENDVDLKGGEKIIIYVDPTTLSDFVTWLENYDGINNIVTEEVNYLFDPDSVILSESGDVYPILRGRGTLDPSLEGANEWHYADGEGWTIELPIAIKNIACAGLQTTEIPNNTMIEVFVMAVLDPDWAGFSPTYQVVGAAGGYWRVEHVPSNLGTYLAIHFKGLWSDIGSGQINALNGGHVVAPGCVVTGTLMVLDYGILDTVQPWEPAIP
jgi:hypothetical protein